MRWLWSNKKSKSSITLGNVKELWDAVTESAQEDENVKKQMAQFFPYKKSNPIQDIVNETTE